MDFNYLASKGFHFPYAKALITKGNRERLAMDADLITEANGGIPAEFGAYIDPETITILTAKRGARELGDEVQKGDFATPYTKFRIDEYTGVTTPYSDEGDGAVAGYNPNWGSREQYRFQTTVRYGDLEAALGSMARINIAEQKQRAAANILDVDANKFYLLGVDGRDIYGLLNEPNLPAAITPETGDSGELTWESKTTKEIFEDILKLYKELLTNSGGNVDVNSRLALAVSPALSVELGKATDYNVSARSMLEGFFGAGKLDIVTLPELSAEDGTETVLLIAREVKGQPTMQFGFSEKLRAGRVIAELSQYKQKFSSTTYGCILYRPFAVAQMVGC